MRRFVQIVGIAFVAALAPSAALGQSGPVAFAEVATVLKQGDLVMVTDKGDAKTLGRVVVMTRTEITVNVVERGRMGTATSWTEGAPRTFLEDDVAIVVRATLEGKPTGLVYRSSDTFGDLGRELRPGHTATITQASGVAFTGKVLRLSSSEVVIATTGQVSERAFAAAEVTRIQRVGNLWDGALKGFLIADGLPLISNLKGGGAFCGPCHLMLGGIGALIGLGIDAAFGPATVYQASPRGPRLAVQPLVVGGRKGVRFTITF